MPKKLKLRVGSAEQALDAFELAWNRAAEGSRVAPAEVLAFEDLPLLFATLTPARWVLLRRLRDSGPSSVNALAKLLARDYKNVHTDVKALEAIGLVTRDGEGRAAVDWDIVSAELRLDER